MYEKSLSIVLRSIDYKDNDRMLTLMTRDRGKISCLARGARKQNHALFGLTDIFVCAEFEFYKRNSKYIVTQGMLRQNFYNIRRNAEAMSVAAVIAESCEKAAVEEETDTRLFALLAGALFALDNGAVPTDVFCFFVIKLLDVLGMRPQTEHCVICGAPAGHKLNLSHGGAVCENCPGEIVPGTYLEDIRRILQTPSRDMTQFLQKSGYDFVLFCSKWLSQVLLVQPKSLKVMHSLTKK